MNVRNGVLSRTENILTNIAIWRSGDRLTKPSWQNDLIHNVHHTIRSSNVCGNNCWALGVQLNADFRFEKHQ